MGFRDLIEDIDDVVFETLGDTAQIEGRAEPVLGMFMAPWMAPKFGKADTLKEISLASAALQRTEQDKRFALEQRLQNKDETHHKELTDEQTKQARLRDRLATADLRLSVVLDAADATSGCSVPTTTATGRVVHGTTRAQLDPAHAQRPMPATKD